MTDGPASPRRRLARGTDRVTRALLGGEGGELDALGPLRLALYAGIGAAIGLVVAGLERLSIETVLHELLTADLWIQALAPGAGLAIAAVVLGAARVSPATSDEYVRAYHDSSELPVRAVGPRLVAALATIGGGGAVGLEGPSIYFGSFLGQRMGGRLRGLLGAEGPRILLVAGAAAGVSAVFKAPATGVLFALEAPYQRDLSSSGLIPSLIASASAYLTFVALVGTERFLPVVPSEVPLRDEILGALLVGVLAGIVARLLASLFHWAKLRHGAHHPFTRAVVAAGLLAAVVVAADALIDVPVALGPGAEQAVEVVLRADVALGTVVALFALRALATATVLGAGGVGGVFVPLVVQGLLLGRVIEEVVGAEPTGLYPAIALAAVLGAGYRVPLAAVMFVAETTGQAGFVIPALLATAVSQALMGSVSVTAGQVTKREGMLERRLRLPVASVTIAGVGTVHPDDSLAEVIDRIGATAPAPALPVYDEEYRGLLFLRDIATVMMNRGLDAVVADAITEAEPIRAHALAVEAAQRMADEDTAVLAVCDDAGQSVGVVTAISLTGLAALRGSPS